MMMVMMMMMMMMMMTMMINVDGKTAGFVHLRFKHAGKTEGSKRRRARNPLFHRDDFSDEMLRDCAC
eukprot:1465090-Karenia_brevis.AAC.1